MHAETRSLLSRPELLEARERGYQRLRELRQRPETGPVYVSGILGASDRDPLAEPEAWVEGCLDDLARRCDEALAGDSVFRPLVLEYGLYGVHFVDSLFGAEVFELEPGNWQARPLKGVKPGRLEKPDWLQTPPMQLARRALDRFLEADCPAVCFGLPTLANSLNIAMNLFGQELMLAFQMDPEAARHDLAVINETILELHHWYRERLPAAQAQAVVAFERTQAPGHGQACGCSNMLLSAAQYAEFIAPLDEALFGAWPEGGMLHLCGSHLQHLPLWREMPALKALQFNDRAAEDLPHYYAGTRPDQLLHVNPCPGMDIPRILETTGGHRTVIVGQAPQA